MGQLGIPSSYTALRAQLPEVMAAYEALGEACAAAGPLDAKTVALVKLGISLSAGLEGAAHSHARKALEAGCTKEELLHVATLCTPTIGFPAMMRGRKWVQDVVGKAEGKGKSEGGGAAGGGMNGAPRTPAEAVAALTARLRAVGTERVVLREGAGRVLAEAVVADRPSPAADVSAMDGYAVRVGDLGAERLRISAEAAAGMAPVMLEAGTAVRIGTGAVIPSGAEAVVRREDVEEGDGWIAVSRAVAGAVRAGENIRRRGENIAAGEVVVDGGREVTAAVAGALAAFGVARPLVHRCVRVAVLVTGDEVLPVESAPEAWHLRDSNGAALRAMLSGKRWVEAVDAGRGGDDLGTLRRAVEGALEGCDALVVTGGVSMGERDFVPRVLREAGAEVLFHKLPQRPGKPVLGGVVERRGVAVPVLALPGNPVSVMVTARRMLAPVLRALAGIVEPEVPPVVRVKGEDGKRLELWWHRLARIVGPGEVELVGGMGSGDVAAAARSDGFVEVPPGESAGEGPRTFYSWAMV